MVPTLLEACGVARPAKPAIDGVSFLPLLKGEKAELKERTLFFQWHRGDVPKPGRAFAARSSRYKLVQPLGADGGKMPDNPPMMLFDMTADPYEEKDIAAERPDVTKALRYQYDEWFRDVCKRGFAPPWIVVGSDAENPTVLTRQDWRGPQASWNETGRGYWDVRIERAGKYDVKLRFPAAKDDRVVDVTLGGKSYFRGTVPAGAESIIFGGTLPGGEGRLEAAFADGRGPHYVEMKRVP
jgi:hypothetical protein